jgi:four helix bundle protein
MSYKKDSIVVEKAFEFAIAVIKMTKVLPKTYENIIIIRQIIRSVTSIGANIEEALGANSRKEFIHSMNIAKKEARETKYWLKMLSKLNNNAISDILLQECEELISILTSIVKTSTYNS